jgi:hypothetical protein
MSDTILKWDYPRTIPAKFGLIWLDGFREEEFLEINQSERRIGCRRDVC